MDAIDQEIEARKAAAKAKKQQAAPSFWDAVGLGAAQGATAGFADEINGGVQALGNKILPESLGGGRSDTYEQERDAFRNENNAARKEHPYAYGGGEIAGGLPAAVATGSAGAASNRILLASGLGSAAGTGHSESGDLAGIYKDATLGGVIGAATQGAGEAVGAGMSAAKQSLSDSAALKYFNAAHPSIRDYKLVGGKEAAIAVGKRLKDEGVVGFGSNAEGIAKAIKPKLQEGYNELDAVHNALTEQGGPQHLGQIKAELKNDVLPGWRAGNLDAGRNSAESAIDKLGTHSANGNEISFNDLRMEKSGLGKSAKFNSVGEAENSAAKQDVYGALSRSIEKRAQQVSPELADRLKAANLRVSQLSDAQRIAVDSALKEAREKGVDITDALLTVAGAMAGGGPIGGVAAVGRHMLRGRMSSMSAKSLDVLSGLMGASGTGVKAATAGAEASERIDMSKPKKKSKKRTNWVEDY